MIQIAHLRSHRINAAAAMLFAFAILPALFSAAAYSQGRQLSLADILIALRSKKASLAERNKLLSDAVSDRGTTFSLTPEIEKELSVTGADKLLINSIRKGVQKEKSSVVNASVTEPSNPAGNTTADDPAFFENRAIENVAKGDLDAAIIDFTKAIELNPSSLSSLLGRSNAYISRNLFTLAIADLNKAIELDPQNTDLYSRRGNAYEKKSNPELALEDYKKAFQLDPKNEIAKAAVDRWNAAQAKVIEPPAEPPVTPKSAPVVLPEFVELGRMTEAQTTKLVKPFYTQAAMNARISGQVIVEIELDTKGNVTKAKTISGHPYLRGPSEDAARSSKFKPAMIGDVAVKAKGTVAYNFVQQSFR